MPLEKAISRRLSIKDNYDSQTDVLWEPVLKVLGGSYGYSALARAIFRGGHLREFNFGVRLE